MEGISLRRLLDHFQQQEPTGICSSEPDAARIPPAIALQIAIHVADALDYAYYTALDLEQNPLHLVHGDVRPSNIFLRRTGGVKLCEFGFSSALHLESRGISPRSDFGTLQYMAPERLVSMSVPASPSSDVYALAIVLFEMLVVEPFWQADSGDISELLGQSTGSALIRNRLRALAGLQHQAALSDVIALALNPVPSLRIQAAREFSIALQALLKQFPPINLSAWIRTTLAAFASDVSNQNAVASDTLHDSMPCGDYFTSNLTRGTNAKTSLDARPDSGHRTILGRRANLIRTSRQDLALPNDTSSQNAGTAASSNVLLTWFSAVVLVTLFFSSAAMLYQSYWKSLSHVGFSRSANTTIVDRSADRVRSVLHPTPSPLAASNSLQAASPVIPNQFAKRPSSSADRWSAKKAADVHAAPPLEQGRLQIVGKKTTSLELRSALQPAFTLASMEIHTLRTGEYVLAVIDGSVRTGQRIFIQAQSLLRCEITPAITIVCQDLPPHSH